MFASTHVVPACVPVVALFLLRTLINIVIKLVDCYQCSHVVVYELVSFDCCVAHNVNVVAIV